MLLDSVLVPARCLVDGEMIVQETGLEAVDYLHVELDSHDVVQAEGAPSETFVDDNSRGIFHNAAEFAVLYPETVAHWHARAQLRHLAPAWPGTRC